MSDFIKVSCECGNEQTVFSHAAGVVKCQKCGSVLANPSGGKAHFAGKEKRAL